MSATDDYIWAYSMQTYPELTVELDEHLNNCFIMENGTNAGWKRRF